MNDPTTVDLYFGHSGPDNTLHKSIKFTDLYGKRHECDYAEALTILIKDLDSKKDEMNTIQKEIGEKMRKTESNQNYNKLNGNSKHRINITLNQISKVSTIIGNMVKYITIDLDTFNKTFNKILKSSNIKTNISSDNSPIDDSDISSDNSPIDDSDNSYGDDYLTRVDNEHPTRTEPPTRTTNGYSAPTRAVKNSPNLTRVNNDYHTPTRATK